MKMCIGSVDLVDMCYPSFVFSRACAFPVADRAVVCSLHAPTLGVDYGLRRTGVAVSVGISPRLLPTLHHACDAVTVARRVSEIARTQGCHVIVVGDPIDARGMRGEQSVRTEEFVDALCGHAGWADVWMVDERWSSVEARERGGRGEVDSKAAGVVLERFFEESGRKIQDGVGKWERSGGAREWKRWKDWRKEIMGKDVL